MLCYAYVLTRNYPINTTANLHSSTTGIQTLTQICRQKHIVLLKVTYNEAC